jgi:cell division protein FtsX
MLSLASLLGAIVPLLATRVLVSLGIGTVTFVGLSAAFGTAAGFVQSYFGSIGGDAANLISLMGVGSAMGILLGALSARLSMIALSKLAKVL